VPQRKKLTNSAVEAFACGLYTKGNQKGETKKQDTLWCGELRGFGMRLSAMTGTRTYIYSDRVRGTGEPVYVTIGRHNDPWRVDQARAKALELKAMVLSGVNPNEERERRIEAKRKQDARDVALGTTLRQVMEDYLVHKRTKHGPLRPETKRDIRRHVEVNLSDWIDDPVASITRDKVISKFDKLSEEAPIQGNACMRYLRALCNHAREMHATPDGDYPILAINPVKQMLNRRKLNLERARTDRIPLNKVGAVWLMLRKRAVEAPRDHERTACDWLSVVLLTGLRRTESGALRKANVNLEQKVIYFPGDVEDPNDGFAGVKNHNDLFLPMSSALYEILAARISAPEDNSPAARRRRRERSDKYVFPSFGRKKPYITGAPALLREVSAIAGCPISLHSLRRTADDIAKKVKVDADERRQLLNHVASDVHGTFYSNNPDPEELRASAEAIAQYVLAQAKIAEAQATGANVVRFPDKTG